MTLLVGIDFNDVIIFKQNNYTISIYVYPSGQATAILSIIKSQEQNIQCKPQLKTFTKTTACNKFPKSEQDAVSKHYQ